MSQIISFPGLGFSVTIDPNALCIGDFCIKWYGVLFAAAFLCGTLYAIKNAKKFGLDEDRMLDVLLGAIVCGVIGARLYYVAFSWERYRNNPSRSCISGTAASPSSAASSVRFWAV
ncbi:MAG: prolipoprotein diacylglyceryl transferase [Oscillospiraceae bacterium]|nr:prolipoprotein diacylglyceryl transferase [Oscillospiraceae bacterium]